MGEELPRHRTSQLARHIQEKGLPGTLPKLTTPESAQDWWRQHKKEIYAITAVLSRPIIDRGLTQNPLRTLEEQLGERMTVRGMYLATSLVVNGVFMTEAEKFLGPYQDKESSEPRDQRIEKAYDRLSTLLLEAEKHGVTGRNTDSVMIFVKGGLGTASILMTSICEVLPSIYEQRYGSLEGLDPDRFKAIAQRSYGLLAHLASMDIDHFTATVDLLSKNASGFQNPLIHDPFTLEGELGSERIVLTQEYKNKIAALPEAAAATGTKNEHGCPALVAFSGKQTMIKEMWEWIIPLEIETYIYSKRPKQSFIK